MPDPHDPTAPETPVEPVAAAAPAAAAPLPPDTAAAASALAQKLAASLVAEDLAHHRIGLINKYTGQMDMYCDPQPDGSITCG